MKTTSQFINTIIPPLICASIFASASWVLFRLSGPTPDLAAVHRLEKLRTLQQQDDERLNSYGWVNRAKGWVRMPIERAMLLEEQRLQALLPQTVESAPLVPVSFAETPP